MGPAGAEEASTQEPAFSFPPSPPQQLGDSFVPPPVPELLEQVQSFDGDAAWLGEREWYAGAEPEASECDPNNDQDFEPGADVEEPVAGESESSSSSDSSCAGSSTSAFCTGTALPRPFICFPPAPPRVASCVAESGIKQFLSRFVGV